MDDKKTLKEIIREELEKLSKLTWGQRFGYIWDYYKPLMAAIFGVIFVIVIGVNIYHNLQLKQLLNVYLLNSNSFEIDTDQIAAGFGEYIGGLGEDDVVTVDASLDLTDTTSQYGIAAQTKFTALISAAEVDILILDRESYERYSEMEYFADLSDVLSAEQMEKWADLLVQGEGTEAMQGLDLTGSPILEQYNAYGDDTYYGAVVLNGEHLNLCDDFFEYLFTEPQKAVADSTAQ